jgi:putative transposase
LARRCIAPTKLHLDFLPVEERVVDTTGIVLDYIHYQSPHLQKWVGARAPGDRRNPRKFLIRRDPRDLSVIYFWDPDDRRYYAVPYRTPTRPRITLWELQQTRKAMKDRNLSNIDEDLIFRLLSERRATIKRAAAATETRRRVKAEEARRQALEGAERQRAAIASEIGAPAVAQANGDDGELLSPEDVTSIGDVM